MKNLTKLEYAVLEYCASKSNFRGIEVSHFYTADISVKQSAAEVYNNLWAKGYITDSSTNMVFFFTDKGKNAIRLLRSFKDL